METKCEQNRFSNFHHVPRVFYKFSDVFPSFTTFLQANRKKPHPFSGAKKHRRVGSVQKSAFWTSFRFWGEIRCWGAKKEWHKWNIFKTSLNNILYVTVTCLEYFFRHGMIWPLNPPQRPTRIPPVALIPESAKVIHRAICGATATCAVPGSSGREKGKGRMCGSCFSNMILIYFIPQHYFKILNTC